MGNINKRIEKLELKAAFADAKKAPSIIFFSIKRSNFVCPGYQEQMRRIEAKGGNFLHKDQRIILIRVADDCGKGCSDCKKRLIDS
jgi:hypothetical protein